MRHVVQIQKPRYAFLRPAKRAGRVIVLHGLDRKRIVVAGHHLALCEIRQKGHVPPTVVVNTAPREHHAPVFRNVLPHPRRYGSYILVQRRIRSVSRVPVEPHDVQAAQDKQRQNQRARGRQQRPTRSQNSARPQRRGNHGDKEEGNRHPSELQVRLESTRPSREERQHHQHGPDPAAHRSVRQDNHTANPQKDQQRVPLNHVRSHANPALDQPVGHQDATAPNRGFVHHVGHKGVAFERNNQQGSQVDQQHDARRRRQGAPRPPCPPPRTQKNAYANRCTHQCPRRPLQQEQPRDRHRNDHPPPCIAPLHHAIHARGKRQQETRRKHRADRTEVEHPEEDVQADPEHQQPGAGRRHSPPPDQTNRAYRQPGHDPNVDEPDGRRIHRLDRRPAPERKQGQRNGPRPGRRSDEVDNAPVPVRVIGHQARKRPCIFPEPEHERRMIVAV